MHGFDFPSLIMELDGFERNGDLQYIFFVSWELNLQTL